jgi:transcriptional antiterminator RfaH
LKREHIAASHLQREAGAEVFLPRIRFQRSTRQGIVWVTEALFPNYLFARFNWRTAFRHVQHARGVAVIVHFGERWPTVPDDVIAELRRALGPDNLHVIPTVLEAGDNVEIAEGAFSGLRAVVTQVMPARDRVRVLLEFLGRQTAVELDARMVIKDSNVREDVL